jgi:hypothetical protein
MEMIKSQKIRLQKMLYGTFFIFVLPLYFIFLANSLSLPFEVPKLGYSGSVMAIIGLAIMIRGMYELKVKGNGLPMNAFPPEELVEDGIYGVFPHPIYFGFCIMCIGISIFYKSVAGLYLVTPVIIGGCMALVLGYENLYLKKKFGKVPHPLLGISNISKPFIKIFRLNKLWNILLKWAENRANSWKSWRFGKLRIINHFLYSGLAGGISSFIITLILGKKYSMYIVILMFVGLIGAAIIGQILVGSTNRLSRPFGYFGSLFGVSAAGLIISIFYPEIFKVLGAFAIASPVAQAIGRIRCLIQGCCHGDNTEEGHGIVVNNPHSRVCALSHKCGVPIYPTPLYSIIGNVILEIILLFYWISGVKYTIVIGLYLIGAGITRFIEEAYRGEPLTKIIGNLRIYQWFSVGMYFFGLIVMIFPSGITSIPETLDYGTAFVTGVIFFLISSFAMSMDFPDSTRRYSRLSG